MQQWQRISSSRNAAETAETGEREIEKEKEMVQRFFFLLRFAAVIFVVLVVVVVQPFLIDTIFVRIEDNQILELDLRVAHAYAPHTHIHTYIHILYSIVYVCMLYMRK